MTKTNTQTKPVQNFAIIGAGMAGIACARTLIQAGHRVTVFEKAKVPVAEFPLGLRTTAASIMVRSISLCVTLALRKLWPPRPTFVNHGVPMPFAY